MTIIVDETTVYRCVIVNASQMARCAEDLISQATTEVTKVLPIAKESVVYRASVAYLFQHIRLFAQALQKLKGKEFTSSEVRALGNFLQLMGNLAALLPQLGKNYFTSILNYSSVRIHKCIDQLRSSLAEICQALSIDWRLFRFEKGQDTTNKIADLQHLKEVLKTALGSKIAAPNSVDVTQLIEIRLESLDRHLRQMGHHKLKKQPSSDEVPVRNLQKVIEDALSVFTAIDIPCEHIKLQGPLGAGGFGTVYMATRLPTAELLAVKEVRSDRLNYGTWASLYSEIATMMELKHPYVLELVGVHVKEPYRIITRYCPGRSLFDRLHKSSGKHLTPPQLTEIASQVAQGMKFLHANGIVHRDLKTMNILLDENDVVKIADFGLAGIVKDGEGLKGGVGTPHYGAPEVLEKKSYGPKVDIFSFGVILWEMAARQIPYRDKTPQEIYEYVVIKGKRLPNNPSIPAAMFELITRCWSANPNERPEFSEIVELFASHKVSFQGSYIQSSYEEERKELPMDVPYLLAVLEHPSHEHFQSVVRFLVKHLDAQTLRLLRQKNILSTYTLQSQHPGSILQLASRVLLEKDVASFINSFMKPVIGGIFEKGDSYEILCALSFCLRVPDSNFDEIKVYTPLFVQRIHEPRIGPFVVRLIARGTIEEARQYKKELLEYFDAEGISNIKDGLALEAVTKLFPMMTEDLTGSQVAHFIPLLEVPTPIPKELITMLVSKTSKEASASLNLALIKAAYRTDVTDIMISSLNSCDPKELEQYAQHLEVFDQLHRLIVEGRSIKVALLLLFRLAQVGSIPTILATHPMLHSVLDVKGHVAQKLQIFTCLLADEQFCIETTALDDIFKLLLSALTHDRLACYVLKMIGALSSHPTGRDMILEMGLLSIFTDIFLTPGTIDISTSLTILSNMSQVTNDIPQLSLIISCLMQDVLNTTSWQCDLLCTLTKLVSISPASVQDYDIRQAIVPLLSPKQGPVLIVLALKLLESCDMSKLAGFYDSIAHRIYRILCVDDLMFPEIILSAVELITSLSTVYDMTHFIKTTGMIHFVENIMEQVKSAEDVFKTIKNCLFALRRSEGQNEQASDHSAIHEENGDSAHEADPN